MLNKEDLICSCCGCVIDEDDNFVSIDDKIYCQDCFEDNFVECYDCGELIPRDDAYYVDSRDYYICGDCYDDDYRTCGNCGEIIHQYDAYYSDALGDSFCEYCFNDSHTYCETCNRYVLNDDYDFDQDCCCDCANYGLIGNYHTHKYEKIGSATDNSFHKGVELEIERKEYHYTDPDELAAALHNVANFDSLNHIYFEHDGSLNDGFEIITNPHTLEEFYNIDWEGLLMMCVESGYISHNAKTCGLHIHYSREWFGEDVDTQIFNIGKLIAFYERHLEDMLKFSRRTWETYTRWADSYHTNGDVESCKSCAYGCNTRYKYINLTKPGTIEFRLGRGTLNHKSFMAWNKFHDCLVRNVKNVSYEDIDNLQTWLEGIDWDTVNYLQSRGCFPTLFE